MCVRVPFVCILFVTALSNSFCLYVTEFKMTILPLKLHSSWGHFGEFIRVTTPLFSFFLVSYLSVKSLCGSNHPIVLLDNSLRIFLTYFPTLFRIILLINSVEIHIGL